MKRFPYLITLFTIIILFITCCKDPDPEPMVECPDGWEYSPTDYDFQIPSTLPQMTIPADNPLTFEGVRLGRMLFHDPILSGDGTLACVGCHLQENSFTDPNQFSIGIDGTAGVRNAMPLINIGYADKLFWDGRVSGLETQALIPVEDPIEMHDTWVNAVGKLGDHADYPKLFYEAFGECDITKELAVKAIAQFERTMISGNSLFDTVTIGGMGIFLSDEAANGFDIFNSERGDCFHCHGGALFTDNEFHNNGLDGTHTDLGLEIASGNVNDRGKFKTPTLRNIELTGPYMHDGRFQTLEEVIDFYSEGLQFSDTVDPLMKNVSDGGLQLTEQEKSDLIAFLKSLTDPKFIQNQDFSNPF